MPSRATQTRRLTRNTGRRRRPDEDLLEVVQVFQLDVIAQAFEQPGPERMVFFNDYSEPELALETTQGLGSHCLASYWATKLFKAVFDRNLVEADYLDQAWEGPSTDNSLWHAIATNRLSLDYEAYQALPEYFFSYRRLFDIGLDLRQDPVRAALLRDRHQFLLEHYPERSFEVWPIYLNLGKLDVFVLDLELADILCTSAVGDGEDN